MFENATSILASTVGGTGRVVVGTGVQYTGTGIRKFGELLVAGGTWLEATGAVMAAKGKAIKMISNGQLTVLGAAALAAGQNVIEVMTAEILSGQPLNMMNSSQPQQATPQPQSTSTQTSTSEINQEEIPPAELAADLC